MERPLLTQLSVKELKAGLEHCRKMRSDHDESDARHHYWSEQETLIAAELRSREEREARDEHVWRDETAETAPE